MAKTRCSYRATKKRKTIKGTRKRKRKMRGGFRKPLLNLGGSGLFDHVNLANSFFPNILGNLKHNINNLLGGKQLFKNSLPNILNLATK